MRGFKGTCDECSRITEMYFVCHVHYQPAVLCGACGRADQVMHDLKEEKYKEVRIEKIYVRRIKEGLYDCFPEEGEIKRREKALASTFR